jgi:hypothetical protein
MASFVYGCLNTGLHAHAWIEGAKDNERTYTAVACAACQRVHLKNNKNGRVIGDDED